MYAKGVEVLEEVWSETVVAISETKDEVLSVMETCWESRKTD